MSQKTIILLYNGIETNLDINLNEITNYESLMKKIHPIIIDYNPSSGYNLMAINSSEPYTILDSDNYMKIMKEEINGENLKLFLNKINSNSMENEDNLQNDENIIDPPPPIFDNIVDVNQEDNEDDDFIIEKDEEKKEEKKEDKIIDNKIEDNKEKKTEKINKEKGKNITNIDENININKQSHNESGEIIYNDNNNDNDNDDNSLYNQTNIMLQQIQNVLGRQDLEIYKHSKTINEPSVNKYNNNQNNNEIKNEPMNFIYQENEENFNRILITPENKNIKNNIKNENNKTEQVQFTANIINPDTFKTIKCSKCKYNLSGIMNICCVCENCILCTNCEIEHYHPCIKYKTPFLCNLKDLYKFITYFYPFKIPSTNFFSKLFRKEYEISINPLTDKKICLRPVTQLQLPIKIINLSKDFIKSTQIDIIPKDNQYVQLYTENQKTTLGPNSPYTLKMKCIAGEKIGKEKILFYCFSEELNLKNQEKMQFNLEFEINEDEDEENLNKKLEYNDNLIVYNKQHKKLAIDILESLGDHDRSKGHLNEVFNILIKNNWDKERSIKAIKSLKK